MSIPGALGLDHYAFAVPRLHDAIDFFCDVLGAQLVMELELAPQAGSWMRDQLDVDERASARAAQLRLGPVTNIELWDYQVPERREVPPLLNERGGHHLAFYVDDVDAAAAFLERQDGVRVLGEPVDADEGLGQSGHWIYFLAPWGLAMKLLSTPPAGAASDRPQRAGPFPQWGPNSKLPTARNVDHLGITVPDLSTAVDLFTGYLGAELVYRRQPAFYDADFTERQLGITGACSLHRALLRLGPTTNLEIMQFDGPGASGAHPRNSDVGGHHLALAVDDVDRASAYLAGVDGIHTFGVPQEAVDGEIKGDRWQYFRLPWGLYGEVLKMPHGVPFGRPHAADRFELNET